jgi:3-methylcrotonyl-CoA carboxylase alpha subunit
MAAKLRVAVSGRTYEAVVDGPTVRLEGVEGEWSVVRYADGQWRVTAGDGRSWRGVAAKTSDAVWVQVDGVVADARVESANVRPRARASEADVLRPPMPATVVRVIVEAGATVAEGDTLIVLEAMKMELPIRAPRAGVVTVVHCREGELVQPTQVLADLE